jgi:hypothetical protein
VWCWRREVGCNGEDEARCACRVGCMVTRSRRGHGAHLASIRRLYASCTRRLPTPGPEQSMLRMGRAHAEPELHVGRYSRCTRRYAVFVQIVRPSSNWYPIALVLCCVVGGLEIAESSNKTPYLGSTPFVSKSTPFVSKCTLLYSSTLCTFTCTSIVLQCTLHRRVLYVL